jgi:hypothetical protein
MFQVSSLPPLKYSLYLYAFKGAFTVNASHTP